MRGPQNASLTCFPFSSSGGSKVSCPRTRPHGRTAGHLKWKQSGLAVSWKPPMASMLAPHVCVSGLPSHVARLPGRPSGFRVTAQACFHDWPRLLTGSGFNMR